MYSVLDHVSKASGTNVTSLTIPYSFALGSLNLGMLVIAMSSHQTETGYPFLSCKYTEVAVDSQDTGQSIGGPGEPVVRCVSFFAPSIFPAGSPIPASGDVVITLDRVQNLVAYVIGLRGTNWPYSQDNFGRNSGPAGPLVSDIFFRNDHLGIVGFATTPSVEIIGLDNPLVTLIESDQVGSGLGFVKALLFRLPPPIREMTAFVNGNPYWGAVGWSCLAELPTGDTIKGPLGEYVKHELSERAGVGR